MRLSACRRVLFPPRDIDKEKHMKITRQLQSAAVVAVALASSSSFADNADFRFGRGDVSFGINVGMPPQPVVEYVPVAVPGYVWVPGHWAWNGHRHFWNSGAWQRVPPGYGHVAGHWRHRHDHWHVEGPYWDRQRAFESHRGHRDHVQGAAYEGRRDPAPSGPRDGLHGHAR